MKVSIIVAKADNRVIGKDNQLIWRLSSDLKHFKNTTTGHYLIMGRKTYESMGGRPLPNRTSIVITRNPDYNVPHGHYVAHSLNSALDLARENGQDTVYVIGGAEIYKMALPLADELIITKVHCSPSGDAYFPEIDFAQWEKIKEEFHPKDERNEFDHTFEHYRRKISS